MAMSRDVVLRLIGDAESAKKALAESAKAANVTVTEYRRAEKLQNQQAAAAKRMAAEQAAAAEVVGSSMLKMGAAIVGGLALAVKAAVDWESSFAGVKKVLKDSANFDVVEKQLRGLASVLPVTHDEIARVAAAAAQLGVQDRNVAAFTKTMIMLGTTTNLSAEEAAMSIARFSNIMGTSQTKASNLGSAIVWLGNNFATTESEIVAMAMRLAGAGRQAGMTEGDILGMATAFSSVGIEAEAGGTAISTFMTRIGNAVRDGGQQLDIFARLSGTTAKDFATKWKSDPAAALASVVTGLGNMQRAGGDVNGTLDQLGITEVRMRDALLRSAAAGSTLTDAISGANNAFSENNALQQEAEARYSTTASQMALLRNGVVEAGISVGQALLPPLNMLVDVVRFVVDGFNSLPGPVQATIGILLGLVGAAALGGAGMLKLRESVAEVKNAFATMKSADGFMGKMGGFLGMLGPAAAIIGIVTTAVSVLSSVFGNGAKHVQDYDGYVSEMADSLRESKGAIDDNARALAAKAVADEKVEGSGKSLVKSLSDMGVELPKVTDAILGNKDAYDQVIGAIDEYIAANDKPGFDKNVADATMAKEKLQELAAGTKDAADKAKLQAEAAAESGDAMSDQGEAAAQAGMTSQEYAQAQADAADAAEQTKQAVSELKDAFDRLNGANIDMLEATSSMTLALAGMGEAISQNGASLDATTESGAKNVQVLSDMVSKAEDVVTATLQQTGSIAEANVAYQAQREAILNAAEAAGLNRDEVAAMLDQIFQMPDDLAITTSTPGATEALIALEELNAEAYKAADGSVQIKVDALTQEAKDKLKALGYDVVMMPNGEFMITALTADAQQGLDAIIQQSGLVDESEPTVEVSAQTSQAIIALSEVGAVVTATPDGKQITVETLSEDAKQKLLDYGFTLEELPAGKGTLITAPGAPESQAAINAVNGAAGNLSNGETVQITAPGAKDSTGQINATNFAAITLSNGEQVLISAPGATTSTGQIQGVTSAANQVPSSKTTSVNVQDNASSKLSGIAALLQGIVSKTVTVTTNYRSHGSSGLPTGASTYGLARGGLVQFYANGGENHVAQYARPGDWRIWAEPETGGEWYIPQAMSKRGRSMSIAQMMLASWGMQMVPLHANRYAQGTPLRSTVSNISGDRNISINITTAASDPHEVARVVKRAIRDEDFLFSRGEP